MVKFADQPVDEQGLKKALHNKIEQLNADRLSLLNRVLLKLEAEDLAQTLDAAFDEDRKAGKLSKDRVEQILSEFRAERPYH